jgi:hypothetical protein
VLVKTSTKQRTQTQIVARAIGRAKMARSTKPPSDIFPRCERVRVRPCVRRWPGRVPGPAVERVSCREMGAQGKRAQRRRREQGCVDGKNVMPPHGKGGRWVDGKKALHNPAHRCTAGNHKFHLPYAFGNAGDRCGDVQRVLNALFAGVNTAFVHYLRTFETEKRVRRWRHDRLCGHFDGRGGMTSPRTKRRYVCPSLSHHRGFTLVFVRSQRHRTVRAPEVRHPSAVAQRPCTQRSAL